MWYQPGNLGFDVVLDDLNLCRNEVRIVSCVARSKRLTLTCVPGFQHEEELSILCRSEMEEVHSLVPHRYLRAWHVAGHREVVRLALDENRWVLTAEVEAVNLFRTANPKLDGKAGLQLPPFSAEIVSVGQRLELATDMRIRDGTYALMVCHGG